MQFFKPFLVVMFVLFLSSSFACTKRTKNKKCNDSSLIGKVYCHGEKAVFHLIESSRQINRSIKISYYKNKNNVY